MITLDGSVGRKGRNRKSDVSKIQKALNNIPSSGGRASPLLVVDGLIGPKTITAIEKFQKRHNFKNVDGRVDVLRRSHALINQLMGHRFSAANLWGAAGPQARDISQDGLGDCFLLATMAALAMRAPGKIRNAIQFNEQRQTFSVRLYTPKGIPRTVQVTQDELFENVRRRGGSKIDNDGVISSAWPAVIETAYAKLNDADPSNGLSQGYRALDRGGLPQDAFMAITGTLGTEIEFERVSFLTLDQSIFLLGLRASIWFLQGKAITFCTKAETPGYKQDKLLDNHSYTVTRIYRYGSHGWRVDLLNPHGDNLSGDEGPKSVHESAEVGILLHNVVKRGGFAAFTLNN